MSSHPQLTDAQLEDLASHVEDLHFLEKIKGELARVQRVLDRIEMAKVILGRDLGIKSDIKEIQKNGMFTAEQFQEAETRAAEEAECARNYEEMCARIDASTRDDSHRQWIDELCDEPLDYRNSGNYPFA